ncbi:phenylacetate--CoA ligase family protein [Homoserinimonas sp. OAct 916]|uniref:phenylacetate--CoA ligase family protein n=1 Tax=Homoserinimonas sp. OAct 916 TaxID=2211450 RepID=UPI000DBE9F98|nr:phenylacetate--CoA ligase family protein [Homoserinimonas sp. OAct 916]
MTLKQAAFNLKTATVLRPSMTISRALQRAETLSAEELLLRQSRRATEQASFAMENTHFYREKYTAAGFTLKDLQDPAAFAELPIVEKNDIRENPELFHTAEATPHNSKPASTGGSTGEPLKLLHDLRFPARVLEWRLFRWWGLDPSQDIALVYRLLRTTREASRYDRKWWPSKRFQLDASRMDTAHIDAFLAEWNRTKPSVLIGYVGGIVELARYLSSNGISISPPLAIAVTAAPMTWNLRSEIEECFHAPVYDHYRCAEVPWLAGECAERNGLHTFADVRKIEVVDPSGAPSASGILGEVVVTDLTNRVFPLIRYRLGDRTSTIDGPCACGISLPRIQSVLGRVTEAAHLPDGQVIAGEALAQIFSKAVGSVKQFQVHQSADYSIIVRCIPGPAPDARDSIDTVIQQMREIVKGAVPIQLEVVTTIPHEGGKIRYITSDVAPPTAQSA